MNRISARRDGVVLSCLDGGSGDDVIVLLHGLAGSGRELVPTAEALLPERHAAVTAEARWDGWQQVQAPTLLVCGQHSAIAAVEVRRMPGRVTTRPLRAGET